MIESVSFILMGMGIGTFLGYFIIPFFEGRKTLKNLKERTYCSYRAELVN